MQEIYIPLMLNPGFGPPRSVHRVVTDLKNHNNCRERVKQVLLQKRAARPFIFPANGPSWVLKPGSKTLVLFLTRFLAAALSSQRFFYSLSLAGLQVKRVTLYFFNYVLSLYLPLEPSQRIFEGFTLLKSNFRQRTTPPTRLN